MAIHINIKFQHIAIVLCIFVKTHQAIQANMQYDKT